MIALTVLLGVLGVACAAKDTAMPFVAFNFDTQKTLPQKQKRKLLDKNEKKMLLLLFRKKKKKKKKIFFSTHKIVNVFCD
jgi:hypothetical protein